LLLKFKREFAKKNIRYWVQKGQFQLN
jgi:hypothetical protein